MVLDNGIVPVWIDSFTKHRTIGTPIMDYAPVWNSEPDRHVLLDNIAPIFRKEEVDNLGILKREVV